MIFSWSLRHHVILVLMALAYSATHANDTDSNWPSWRGPQNTGVAPQADPPVEWHEEKNVRWKTAIPGRGHSSPVVWNDFVFVTSAIPYGPESAPVPVTAPGAHDNVDVTQRHRFVVICLSRATGDILWQQVAADLLPHEGGHNTGSLASGSPVTDGKYVYAWFGSFGLYAYDFEGQLVWQHNIPKLQTKHAHGEGASPALHDGVLVINCDHEEQSFVRAIDTDSGKTIWERTRQEVTSWSSPLIVKTGQRAQVVVAGTDRIRGYDLKSAKVIWECGGLSANVVATPVASEQILIAASSYDTRAMIAINMAGASGDITNTDRVLWTTTQRTPYVPSMLLMDDQVYFLRHYQNILSRRHIRTGVESNGPFRLAGLQNIYASPVAARNRIYVTDLTGATMVFEHAEQPRLLSLNRLDDEFAATPALAGNQLFLRGHRYLYCIEEE